MNTFSSAMEISPTVAPSPGRIHAEGKQVALAARGTFGQGLQRGVAAGLVTRRRALPSDDWICDSWTLAVSTSRMGISVVFGRQIFVDAHEHILTTVHPGLTPGSRFLDPQLGKVGGHCFGHPAHLLDLIEELARLGQPVPW